MNPPRLLVACEFSGIVRDAFKAVGWDAWSCDLLPTERPGQHIQDDVLRHLNDGWDMMIAHPPCKYLCAGGNNWLNRRPDLKWRENREIAAGFFMRFVNAPIEKIAVENPIGCMSSKYRRPDQIIHPWMFNEDYRKDTCLWLKHLPPLMCTVITTGRKKLDFWSTKRHKDGKDMKAITFPGVAKAMAQQWGSWRGGGWS